MHAPTRLPQPAPEPEPLPQPEDRHFDGMIRLEVDATDVQRRIFAVRETIPVSAAGETTLLYPEWLPGYHAPQAPIELLAGLTFTAAGKTLDWRRHPTKIHAFHVTVPEGCTAIEASFQFLSPTDSAQGREVVSPDLLSLTWNAVLLYPAGYYARRITVEPVLTLPPAWGFACALDVADQQDGTVQFAPVELDVLVDSPLSAGRHVKRIAIDERGQVWLNLLADQPDLLDASDEQIEPHRELVRQADRLFGARHFDRYEVLLMLSDEIGSIGVEHHRSCEAASIRGYFADWDNTFARRDTVPHEYIHSWNGKYRRGADSWTPSFDRPIRNSLMWVYEGQTQYWDRVLCARSGLWTADQGRQALAETAATHDMRAGSRWRPLRDTTRDPIIAGRSPLPWPSWQRSEDYYTEGALIWLDVDTRIRELKEDVFGIVNLLFSIGLLLGSDGSISEVLWDSPAFHAALTAGSQIVSVNGRSYSAEEIRRAITEGASGKLIELTVKSGKRVRQVTVECRSGHRYPHLEPSSDTRSLDDILRPLTA